MKHWIFAVLSALSPAITAGALAQDSRIPPEGFVSNADVAIAIARAVSVQIYGAEKIRSEEPLVAELEGDRWLVRGTLSCPSGYGCLGGTVEVTVMRRDGRIVKVTHTQ